MTRSSPSIKISHLPFPIAYVLAHISGALQTVVGECKWLGDLQMLTPNILDFYSIDYVSTSTKAAIELSYQPIYTIDEGIQKSMEEFADQQRKKRQSQ